MGSSFGIGTDTSMPTGWQGYFLVAFLSLSSLCVLELAVLITTLWNNNSKTYFLSLAVSNFCSFCFTAGVMVFFFAPSHPVSKWVYVLLTACGYWVYIPAQYMVMYTRLHLLRPTSKVMLICRAILMAEWILITTPNALLSAGSGITSRYNFPSAYGITQRIEPVFYAFVCIMLSGLYIYHAYVMFRRYRDERVQSLLIRLLYTNLFLIMLSIGSIIAEFVGGAIVQTSYVAFFYTFQLKIELWMLNDIGLLASETLERSFILRPFKRETESCT